MGTFSSNAKVEQYIRQMKAANMPVTPNFRQTLREERRAARDQVAAQKVTMSNGQKVLMVKFRHDSFPEFFSELCQSSSLFNDACSMSLLLDDG